MSLILNDELKNLSEALPESVDELAADAGCETADSGSGNIKDNSGTKRKPSICKPKSFRPIILTLLFILMNGSVLLSGQFNATIGMGLTYTDNAFQLSSYDLQRNEDGHPDLDFVESADDVILSMRFNGSYDTHWRWWKIQPTLQLNGSQYVLNTSRQRVSALVGVKISRRLGELGLYYGYYPDVYIRNYTDSDGTGESERYSYDRDHYRADLRIRPVKTGTAFLQYRKDVYYYNQYFTEFDGDIDTWILGWQQNFPTFYLDASYSYRVYETDKSASFDNPEDASYESNVYDFGIMLKKMNLDSRYPSIQWRPELDLRFEERYYQGGDNWHRNRIDNINTTTARLHFYPGVKWNLSLDYSHIFRNVDAAYSSVRKYKEYSENRFGLNAGYRF